jgi:ectoine hydroxylase-related dioxygenase (phytanoyl-CoA dioxygenase family)
LPVLVSDAKQDDAWLERTLESITQSGVAVVTNVLDEATLDETREALYRTRERIVADVGQDRLDRAGEVGVLRLMLRYEPFFLRFLELPEVLAVVDATVSETAILHLQNGLVLPSSEKGPDVFQTRFHRDFPRILNGYVMSVNTFFAIDPFTAETGGTRFAPGTHQREGKPSDEYLDASSFGAECPSGSMIVFDSTVWHAAGRNTSGRDRLAINQQFTRSYVKQQVDYVRALGDDVVQVQSERTQQLLGWYTRMVTSLDEFYVPAEKRLYRSGQG